MTESGICVQSDNPNSNDEDKGKDEEESSSITDSLDFNAFIALLCLGGLVLVSIIFNIVLLVMVVKMKYKFMKESLEQQQQSLGTSKKLNTFDTDVRFPDSAMKWSWLTSEINITS